MKKAYTLIEILVVIAILTMLFLLITVFTKNAQSKSRDAIRKSDIKSLANALETYKTDNDIYPVVNIYEDGIDTSYVWANGLGDFLKPYIKNMPKDPINNIDDKKGYLMYVYFVTKNWKDDTGRVVPNLDGAAYELIATLENKKDSEAAINDSKMRLIPSPKFCSMFGSTSCVSTDYGDRVYTVDMNFLIAYKDEGRILAEYFALDFYSNPAQYSFSLAEPPAGATGDTSLFPNLYISFATQPDWAKLFAWQLEGKDY